jgi:hypothetical protein
MTAALRVPYQPIQRNDLPITDERGNKYESPVIDGVDPEQIAAILTRRTRRRLWGDDAGLIAILIIRR